MKTILSCFVFFYCLISVSQPYSINIPIGLTVDSSRKPVFCFHYKPIPNFNYRWGFYHSTDIRQEKSPFIASRLFVGRNSDTMICEDFRDSLGVYWVCIEVTFTNGIKDTLCKKINNNFRIVDRWPNVFSPGSKDSLFNIIIENESLYELHIFDRWGVKVFESKDKNIDWNGRKNNQGVSLPDGTYYYILKYRYIGKDKDEPVLNGVVRIMR